MGELRESLSRLQAETAALDHEGAMLRQTLMRHQALLSVKYDPDIQAARLHVEAQAPTAKTSNNPNNTYKAIDFILASVTMCRVHRFLSS